MMLDDLLRSHEGKTIEFKENLSSPQKIIKTVIAFANTAGGVIVVGIEDKTKKIVGIENILQEEERISNLIFDTIAPALMPDIDIINHAGKEILVINVPYLIDTYYFKKMGPEKGTYIRLGSSNRIADPETLANLRRSARRITFDDLPCIPATLDNLDENLINKKLKPVFKGFSKKHYSSLGIVTEKNKKTYATNAGVLLFAKERSHWLPDSTIRCVSFASTEKKNIIDQREISINLIDAVEEVIIFIQRHTSVSANIGAIRREDIPEYPISAIRESVVNALIHADYSIKGASILVAIYKDRIEITNPGGLTFGQTLASALSGVSKMRNPVIGRIFREVGLIETLGMGLQSILGAYQHLSNKVPIFEELDHFFRVTLYSRLPQKWHAEEWLDELLEMFANVSQLSAVQIAKQWNVTVRTARNRLNKAIQAGLVKRDATSRTDPNATYSRI